MSSSWWLMEKQEGGSAGNKRSEGSPPGLNEQRGMRFWADRDQTRSEPRRVGVLCIFGEKEEDLRGWMTKLALLRQCW